MKKFILLQIVVGLLTAGVLALKCDHNSRKQNTPEKIHEREAGKLLRSALKEMGEGYDIESFRKDKGAGPDARVIQYVSETGADPDVFSEGWCNSFVQFQLKINGYEYCADNREDFIMNTLNKTQKPVPGDVAMFLGHIAFVYDFHRAFDGTPMADFLGGAQSGRVCIFSLPTNRVEFYARPIKAPKDWQPMVSTFWQRIENNGITVKRPTPSFTYPTPYPEQ